jgi:hypothetical protein
MVSVSVSSRLPTLVHSAGVAATGLALLPVTKRSKASVSRTVAGIVTRCVVWVAADCAEARKLTTSAAAAG